MGPSGAPNDGFLFFLAFQSTFISVDMHSKRRYKICICSVILRDLEPFRNYNGFSIVSPKILGVI